MCATLLNTRFVQSLSDKIAIARNAKEPAWSQKYLAEKLAGRLGRDFSQWYSRIRNIETRYTPQALELAEISDVLGTDYLWQTTENDLPIQWRRARDLEGVDRGEDALIVKRVPFWGHVPAWGWEQPTGHVESVPTTYEGDSAAAFRIRTEVNMPRFRPGLLILIEPNGLPAEGVYNVARSPEGELQLGLLRRDNGRWFLHFANPDYKPLDIDGWQFIGHAVHAEESDAGGLR